MHNVTIVGNKVRLEIIDPTTLFIDGLKIVGNSTTPLLQIRNSLNGHYSRVVVDNSGSGAATTFYGSVASGLNYLTNFTSINRAGGNSIRVEATVPASVVFRIDGDNFTTGFPDFSGGAVKRLTWA